jgi:hypothetical protein
MRSGLCYECRPLDPFPDVEPEHCFGNGDEPGIPGLIGSGFWCTCSCRTKRPGREAEKLTQFDGDGAEQ